MLSNLRRRCKRLLSIPRGRVMSRAEKPEFDHASSVLYFAVPDIQAAHARMKANRVHFEDEPHLLAKMPDHDLWMVFFRDSEGNLMGLMSEVKR